MRHILVLAAVVTLLGRAAWAGGAPSQSDAVRRLQQSLIWVGSVPERAQAYVLGVRPRGPVAEKRIHVQPPSNMVH